MPYQYLNLSGGPGTNNTAGPSQGGWLNENMILFPAQAQLQRDITGMQTDAAKLPSLLKQQRFNEVFPYLQGQIGQGLGSISGSGGGGSVPPPPDVNVSPVWNEQQIQQQVNASRANNDTATASRMRESNAALGGRGFGSNSPLQQALNTQMQNQNMATNTQNEQQTRWGAAQGNAQQVLNAQTVRGNLWGQQQQVQAERDKTLFGYRSALLNSLAGLAG